MIASEYGIPLNASRLLPGDSAQGSMCSGQVTEGHNSRARRVRAAALALLKYKNKPSSGENQVLWQRSLFCRLQLA